jgi:hypothetical protein
MRFRLFSSLWLWAYIVVLFASISAISASAQMPLEGVAAAENRFSGMTGLTTIREKNEQGEWETFPFYRINLRPEFSFGKVGIGFDAAMLYNPDKGLRTEDGEKIKAKNIVRWIRSFRYGHRGEPLYFLYGALDNVHIGYGFLMAGYYNYDRRGLRLDLTSKNTGGVETILNNITEPEIFGGRFHIQPLTRLIDTPLIKDLTLGASYIADVDPDPNGEGESPLIAYSADAGIPILQGSLLSINLYDELAFLRYDGDFAKVEEYKEEDKVSGKGNATGIGVNLNRLNFNFKVEYRVFNEKFQPSIFDYVYEDLKRKERLQIGGVGKKGIYSLATYNFAKKIFLIGTFEDYDQSPAKVHVEAIETDLVEKLNLRAIYIKRNIEGFEDIFDIDDKSALRFEIGYEFMPPLQLIVAYDFTFRQRDDGKGFEKIRKVSALLGVSTKF